MSSPPARTTRTHPRFLVELPDGWQEASSSLEPTGALGVYRGDHHVLRVERVTTGWEPVEALMGQISFLSRRALESYEPGDAEAIVVPGAIGARRRFTATREGGGHSFGMLELFAEGLDQAMWYVRVSARRPQFDRVLGERILQSFNIVFVQDDRDE